MSMSRKVRWVDAHAESALTLLILEDQKGSMRSARGRPPLPAALYTSHIASFLCFESPVPILYVIGGRQTDPVSGNSTKLSSVELFDTWSQRWHCLPSLKANRVGAGACPFGNGGVLIVGGYIENPAQSLATAEAYCPEEGCWKPMPNMRAERYGLVLLQARDGDIYAIGGSSGAEVCSTVEKYSVRTNRWTECASLPEPLAGGRGIEVNGYLLYVGGFAPNGSLSTRIYIYDPANNCWETSKVLLRLPRTTFAMGANTDAGTLILAGGQAQCRVNGYDIPEYYSVCNNVEELNIAEVLSHRQPERRTQPDVTLPCLPTNRTGCLGAFLKDYGFVVIGGEEERLPLPNKSNRPERIEALVFRDGKWRETFPQPHESRVAFGIAETVGYPPSSNHKKARLR